MEYTYDFYKGGRRCETTNSIYHILEVAKHSSEYCAKWFVACTNNLTNVTENFYSVDQIESKIIQLERRVWKGHMTKWEPFNEAESQIHVKDKLTDNNAKTVAAVNKPRMSAVPPEALLALGAAMQDGANKYGLFNWRSTSVSATVFYDAIMRHLIAWYAGEDDAPDSKQSHLAHIMANCAILMDSKTANVFKDDRNKVG